MRERQSHKLLAMRVSLVPPCRSPQARSCCGGDGQMNDRQYLRGQTVPRRGPVRPRANRDGPGARAVGRRLPTPQRQMDAERRGSRGSLRAVRRRRLAPQNPGGQPEPTLLVRREARLTKEINEVGPESLTPTPLFLLGNHYGDEPLNSQYRKTAPTLFFCRSGRLHL